MESFFGQGFMLVTLQRDTAKDGSFKHEDQQFYFRKINLPDLVPGKRSGIRVSSFRGYRI